MRTNETPSKAFHRLDRDFHSAFCLLATVERGLRQVEQEDDPEDRARAGVALRDVVDRFKEIRDALDQFNLDHLSVRP